MDKSKMSSAITNQPSKLVANSWQQR